MIFKFSRSLVAAVCLLFAYTAVPASSPLHLPSSELLQQIEKLNILGSVLYFAAHPDDENTGFIAYMANERKYRTSYLSLTRGDGGQNLIGPEMRELLGMIRTQELLEARKIDGGQQFFTRANDFGYSKNQNETMEIWDKEAVLADAVWVIRKTRPDVIVTRFPPDSRAGHGHHTASALLAAEAFDAAGDPLRFPGQLKYVEVWKPKRLMWNISMWSVRNREEYVKNVGSYIQLDIGGYNPSLGVSYGEMAARSRSMHKSQGFGAIGRRGIDVEYFEYVKGEKATKDLLDGVNTSWERVEGAEKIPVLIATLKKEFDVANPSASLPALLRIRKAVAALRETYWKEIKLQEIDNLAKNMLGLHMEAIATASLFTPGDQMGVSIEVINRSDYDIRLQSWKGPFDYGDKVVDRKLEENKSYNVELEVTVPEGQDYTQPYWLTRDIGYEGMFEVKDQEKIGLPENEPSAVVTFKVLMEGVELNYPVPVAFRKRDPVRGEVYEPLVISPPVYTMPGKDVYMFGDEKPATVSVTVTSAGNRIKGKVGLKLSEGWKASPALADFTIEEKSGSAVVHFQVQPPAGADVGELTAIAYPEDGGEYDRGLGIINYEHISRQVYFPKSTRRLVRFNLEKKGSTIGYIHGAGDAVPEALREIGYLVTVLDDKEIEAEKLKGYDAVIVGVRAYNTRPALATKHATLLEYVKQGGNLIVQYNTSGDLLVKNTGPYPFDVSRERVSVEDAEVRILNPESPVMTTPNKISREDFDGWVQERGLYFPQNWDSRYQTVISTHDPGGAPLDSGILYAPYGKGYYIYSSLSWFRELPAGVPGAYRLFVNLISLGK